MKRITAFCLGIITAFSGLQLLYFYGHGFSFTVIFQAEWGYLIRALSYAAVGLLGVRVWRFLRKGVAQLRVTRSDALYFLLGIVVMAIALILWKLQEGPEVDFKFAPYVVVPTYYVAALLAYFTIEAISWRSNKSLERGREG